MAQALDVSGDVGKMEYRGSEDYPRSDNSHQELAVNGMTLLVHIILGIV